MGDYLGSLMTEKANDKTRNIDECNTIEILTLINDEDSLVAGAVKEEIPKIAEAVDVVIGKILSR